MTSQPYALEREHTVPHRAQTLGMWLFLVSLSVLFAASMVGYAIIRLSSPAMGPSTALELPAVLWLSTALVLSASVTIHVALRGIQQERPGRLRRYLLATMVLAVSFVAVQIPALVGMMRAHAHLKEAGIHLYALAACLVVLHAAHVVGGVVALAWSQEAAEAPAAPAAPTTQQASPEDVAFFGEVREAYNGLQSVEMKGEIRRDIDVAGRQDKDTTAFTSTFKAPNLFRHAMGEEMVVGSTGGKSFAFSTQQNAFLQFDLEADKPLTAGLPPMVVSALQQQNPSLWQAVEEDAMAKTEEVASKMTRVEDVTIDETAYRAFRVNAPEGGPEQTILFDPKTHLIRRVVTDLRPALLADGAPDVKNAEIVIDYTSVDPSADLAAESFAWTAPEGARDVVAEAEKEMAKQPSMQLKGQEAPQFEGTTHAGETFKLADHAGKVVVLDFWATWCAPCVESLPGLQEIAAAAGDDVRVITVNIGEDKEAVDTFLTKHKLVLPIVMDPEMAIAKQYKVQPIPHQVVIDTQGTVQDVFIGSGPTSKKRLQDAIDKAKAAKAPAGE